MTQQAFLEGHTEAFAYFGGVFGLTHYENRTSAVKQVLRGRRQLEAERVVAMRSHYRFESQFTIVARRGAHEKDSLQDASAPFRILGGVPIRTV
jgi:transposase